jgi:hypothetical protein
MHIEGNGTAEKLLEKDKTQRAWKDFSVKLGS